MTEKRVETRFDLLIPPEVADELVDLIERVKRSHEEAALRVRRPAVKGQSLEAIGATLVPIMVAIGGGIGIAAIIREIAQGVAAIIKSRRVGRIVVRCPDGRQIELINVTAQQIEKAISPCK